MKYRQAGVDHIYVGVEAGSQETLDLFKKDTQVEQSKQAIDLINNEYALRCPGPPGGQGLDRRDRWT